MLYVILFTYHNFRIFCVDQIRVQSITEQLFFIHNWMGVCRSWALDTTWKVSRCLDPGVEPFLFYAAEFHSSLIFIYVRIDLF